MDIGPVPIVFTFSVCGSMKTLEFLRWLGVDVPRWIRGRAALIPVELDEAAEQLAVDSADGPRRGDGDL